MNARITTPEPGVIASHAGEPGSAARLRGVTLDVRGLWFEHSDVGLAHQLGRYEGIADIVVDPRAGRATVRFDEGRLTEADVRRLVSGFGYDIEDEGTPEPWPSPSAALRPAGVAD